ncbi:MAG: hypothetical protein LBB09_02505 [Rickettsiales bacterium]|jgi:formyltetrahydrofolate synthetase|nr:hypothetical protein [Rickettsiales bacterium]
MILGKPYTSDQYFDLAVYCNTNGLTIEDRGDYLEGAEMGKDFAKEKLSKLNQIKINNENFIYLSYPIYKQLNIVGRIKNYTDADFIQMKKFIEEQIEKYDRKAAEIENCESLEELDGVDIEMA